MPTPLGPRRRPASRRWSTREAGGPDDPTGPDGTAAGRRVRVRSALIQVAIVTVAVLAVFAAAVRLHPARDEVRVPTGPSSSTLFGASVEAEGGQSYQQAVHESVERFGQLGVIRQYYPGMPAPWPRLLRQIGTLTPDVSFKGAPADVLAGRYDKQLTTWFEQAPTDRTVYWTYFHEPEDDIEKGRFTAAQFRAAWKHVHALAERASNARQGTVRLRATLNLMAYSTEPASHRNWKDYYPGRAYVDVLAWDKYNGLARQGRYAPPAQMFTPSLTAAKRAHLPVAYAEFGSKLVSGDRGAGRARWLDRATHYLSDHGAVFVSYFNQTVGGDFRLRDKPSRHSWRTVVTRAAPWQQPLCPSPPVPSSVPSSGPSSGPSGVPSGAPSAPPTSGSPSGAASEPPSGAPSGVPCGPPSGVPSDPPSGVPCDPPPAGPSGRPATGASAGHDPATGASVTHGPAGPSAGPSTGPSTAPAAVSSACPPASAPASPSASASPSRTSAPSTRAS